MNKVELQNLVGGQLQEKFERAFESVIENLQDPNTSFKVKRGITIKLSFTQNENRDDVSVSAQVVEKLAPQQDMNTKFYIGTVEAGSVSEYGDDGVTQKATIKTGLASKGDAIVPNPVCLRPYRTFLEVEQPESAFVFRMKQDNYGSVMCAVFEADGGAWKMDATQAIKEYLQRELDGMPQFTVIS